jgi:serine/threonine protein phosphatase PrpC
VSSATRPTALPKSFTSVFRTHPGGQRTVNEDRVLDRPEAGLWAVADGMGGHRSGEAAAERLVAALAGVVHGASGYGCLADIEREVQRVNAGLYSDPDKNGERSISGATLVTLLIHEDHYACLWAGDSRAYLLRDGVLFAITRDHSVVQALVDTGALSEDGRRTHPSAHMITRAVGAAPRLELDRRFARIAAGDVYLLCSDGLTGCVDDAEIAQALGSAPAEQAADWLLSTALARNASDNVSFVIIGAG